MRRQVGNADSNDISVFRVEPETDEMTLLETTPYVGGRNRLSSAKLPLGLNPC